jgi:hypothetical protein
MKKIASPNNIHYAMYYDAFINLVPKDADVLLLLKNNIVTIANILKVDINLLVQKQSPTEWCVLEIIQHLIDYERLMIARLLHFLRQDGTVQPWFDEKVFAQSYKGLKPRALMQAYKTQRQASLVFFKQINAKQYKLTGMATNYPMSIAAGIYILCGHELHHLKRVEEMALKSLNKYQ